MDDIKDLITRLRYNNRKSGWSDIDRMMDEAAEALENLDAQLDVLVKEDIEAQQELAGYRALGTLEHLRGMAENLDLIISIANDYDGYRTVKGLMALIDELADLAAMALRGETLQDMTYEDLIAAERESERTDNG